MERSSSLRSDEVASKRHNFPIYILEQWRITPLAFIRYIACHSAICGNRRRSLWTVFRILFKLDPLIFLDPSLAIRSPRPMTTHESLCLVRLRRPPCVANASTTDPHCPWYICLQTSCSSYDLEDPGPRRIVEKSRSIIRWLGRAFSNTPRLVDFDNSYYK